MHHEVAQVREKYYMSDKKKCDTGKTSDLRKRAEKKADRYLDNRKVMSAEEMQRTLYELQVHQIELEMQGDELRKTMDELDVTRARYYNLYDLAPVGYCTVSEKGLILEANLTAATLLGLLRETLLKQPFSKFVFKEDHDIYYLHRKQLFDGSSPDSVQATQVFDLRMLKKDGSPFWAHLSATAAQAEDGAPLCRVVMNDITELKRTEEALRESEKLLSRAQEMAHTGSWKLDLTSNSLTWSDEVYRIFGCKPQEFAATYEAFLNFVHPEDRAVVDDAYSRSHREGKDSYEFEHRIVRRNSGEVRHVQERCVHERDAAGTIIQSTGMVQDITTRKRADEAATREHVFSKAIIDSIPGTFYALDEHGGYVRWNAYQRDEIIGRPEEKTAGFNALDTIHPDDREEIGARIANVLKNGTVETVAGRVLLRGGPAFRWFLMTGRKMVVDGKAFLVGIGIDITERKRVEEELKEKMNELQRFHDLTVGRELNMIELKKEVNELLRKSGRKEKYRIVN